MLNRRILYRGKRADSDAWVHGYYSGPVGPLNIHEIIDVDSGESVEVEPDTVSQFTGRLDCQSVMIFEDDILRDAKGDGSKTFVAKFGRSGGVQNADCEVGYVGFYVEPVGAWAQDHSSFGLRTDILYWLNSYYDMAVVGNIHDNPELVGVRK